ncbi:hypothetical protein GOBAR_DD06840 [Gossypium barbadense]|nr:hypothetical protein GOBAR_DD06840 [Gossypium barbadense]
MREECPKTPIVLNQSVVEDSTVAKKSIGELVAYEPWMVVERKSRQNPNDTQVSLKDGVIDSSRHSTISFKENLASFGEGVLKGNSSVETMKGIHVSKRHGNGGKADSNRNGKIRNKIIQGRGE